MSAPMEIPDVIGHEDAKAIILALCHGQADRGTTEEEMERAVEWARQTRIAANLLSLVLGGVLMLRYDEQGELTFGARTA